MQVASRNITVKSEGDGCQATVPLHGCDKVGFLAKRRRRIQCVSVPRQRQLKLTNCGPFTKLHYRDSTCRGKRNRRLEIGCDILVPRSG